MVRPGGRVVVLEFDLLQRVRRCRGSISLWFDRVVPLLGRLAGDPDAYSYLPNSVKRFPAPAEVWRRCSERERVCARSATCSPPGASS